jgi:hypothetical protein
MLLDKQGARPPAVIMATWTTSLSAKDDELVSLMMVVLLLLLLFVGSSSTVFICDVGGSQKSSRNEKNEMADEKRYLHTRPSVRFIF